MITFNTRHSIDESNLDKALHKLVAAFMQTGTPLVITDTWYLDGKQLPRTLVMNAIWRYLKLHGLQHGGISFAHEPLALSLNEIITQLCKKEEFKTPRYSLVKENNTAKPVEGRQARAFDVMRSVMCAPEHVKSGISATQAAMLRQYQSYFDVLMWRWVYNTVQRTALQATEEEAHRLDPT